jgi:predicted O-linked N-acetylglucosamine transferase (SPINDLY family)
MARLPIDLMPPGRPSSPEGFMQAAGMYQHGDLNGARRILKQILRKAPQNFDALHLMGVIESRLGHHKEGEKLVRQAVRINPQSADAHSNRGNIQREMGDFAEALASFDRALAIRPDYANAHNNRAIALMELGRLAESVEAYDRAIAFQPGNPNTHYNRAMALARMGRNADALAGYDRALALAPDHLVIHVDRGNTLVQLGRIDDALAAYEKVLVREPAFAPAHYNRGLALVHAGRLEEAITSFDRALAAEPEFASALDSRANALMSLGRFDEALESFERAAKAAPRSAAMRNNRGYALMKLRRFGEALESFDKALAIDPKFAGALGNRGNVLMAMNRTEEALKSFDKAIAADPDALDALGNRATAAMTLRRYDVAVADYTKVTARDADYPYALGNLLFSKLQNCDWSSFGDLTAQVEAGVRAGKRTALPFAFISMSDNAADQLQAAKSWLADVKLPHGAPNVRKSTHPKIRLGYLSADFHDHPVSALLAELFEKHDRSRFEVEAFAFGPDDGSAMRARLRKGFDAFHDVRGLDDHAIARRIAELNIDIAIDLMGYTENCRPGILSQRPAPVQALYLGYPSTTGGDFIDYAIADANVLPESQQTNFSERAVYLPGSFMTGDAAREIGAVPSRAQAGLPEQGFVFCCFNNRYKITPPVFDIWMRLLTGVEGSVLWLSGGNPASMDNLRREAQARGVAPERLVFAPRVEKLADHLARHRLADIFLDTLPYNAHSTANDALYAGLPVLTCAGEAFASRVAASLLHAVGMPELVTNSPVDYEALALKLARDPSALAAVKSKLAANRATSPLFDTEKFSVNIEAAYEQMWQRHQRGEQPAGFAVAG